MRNNFEKQPPELNTGTSVEVPGSVEQNRTLAHVEHNYYTSEKQKAQAKNHQNIEKIERQQAEDYLTEELENLDETISSKNDLDSFLKKKFPNNSEASEIAHEYFDERILIGLKVDALEIEKRISKKLEKEVTLSTADQIKTHIFTLEQSGRNRIDILKILVGTYENESAVKTWVESWKNFLALNEFAATKPPAEQKAIEQIISRANFTAENSFDTALKEISGNAEISTHTKIEISKKFGGEHVQSVSQMDNTLRRVKNHKQEIEKAINAQETAAQSLESEIADLEKQLENLPPGDSKRNELEAELAAKTQQLEETKTDLKYLEKHAPNEVSFVLRQGVSAKLNPNGSRLIRLNNSGFEITLPDNRLFMGRKNLNSINLAFSYRALQKIGLADVFFVPALTNGSIPLPQQCKHGARILQALGYNTDEILSQTDILQLEKDLGLLKQKGSNNSPIEDLQELGIWDVSQQEVNQNRLFSALKFIRENRGDNLNFEELKKAK